MRNRYVCCDNGKKLSIASKYQAESVDAKVSEYRGETIEIASISLLNIVIISRRISISLFSYEWHVPLSVFQIHPVVLIS